MIPTISIVAGKQLFKELDKRRKLIRKSMYAAIFTEGRRVWKELRWQLKAGRLGLEPLSRYRNEHKDPDYKRPRKRQPLAKLFKGVMFSADKNRLSGEVGFLGTTEGTAWQKKLAEKHVDGFNWIYTPDRIESLHRIGVHLKPGTTSGKVPGRDIIGTYHDKQGRKIAGNIKSNFERKMRGERL